MPQQDDRPGNYFLVSELANYFRSEDFAERLQNAMEQVDMGICWVLEDRQKHDPPNVTRMKFRHDWYAAAVVDALRRGL